MKFQTKHTKCHNCLLLRLVQCWLISLFLVILGARASDKIQLSLLNDQAVIEDTLDILKQAGCGKQALEGFSTFVSRNRDFQPVKQEVKKLMINGYFELESVPHLLSVTPPSFSGLINIQEPLRNHSLMCFDVALLLLREGPVHADSVMQHFSSKHFLHLHQRADLSGSYLVSKMEKPGEFAIDETLLSPQKAYQRLTGLQRRSVKEEHLAISLRSPRAIPGIYANSESAVSELFNQRRALWKRDGLKFSKDIKVILAHWIDLDRGYMAADHIGLAAETESGWMYLEKNGTLNPLVRINFPRFGNIVEYVSSIFHVDRYDPKSPLHQAVFFLSVNEEIHWVGLRNASDP